MMLLGSFLFGCPTHGYGKKPAYRFGRWDQATQKIAYYANITDLPAPANSEAQITICMHGLTLDNASESLRSGGFKQLVRMQQKHYVQEFYFIDYYRKATRTQLLYALSDLHQHLSQLSDQKLNYIGHSFGGLMVFEFLAIMKELSSHQIGQVVIIAAPLGGLGFAGWRLGLARTFMPMLPHNMKLWHMKKTLNTVVEHRNLLIIQGNADYSVLDPRIQKYYGPFLRYYQTKSGGHDGIIPIYSKETLQALAPFAQILNTDFDHMWLLNAHSVLESISSFLKTKEI